MPDSSSPIDLFLAAACDGDQAAAESLLAANPALASSCLSAAAMLGAAETVAEMLRDDPSLAVKKSGPRNWEPLLHLSFSRFHHGDSRRAEGILRSARMLLAAGASPDTFYKDAMFPDAKLPALWAAGCEADHPALVRVLLEAGANPNDGESIYHAAEKNLRACLDLLLEFGVKLSGPFQPWNNTPLYFILGHKPRGPMAERVFGGVQWLLEHGADPNEPSYEHASRPIHLAARNGWGIELFEQLHRHGADLDLRNRDGKTAYALAAQRGNLELAQWLRDRGARTELSPADEFFAACGRGDEAAARALLNANPGITDSFAEADRDVLLEIAEAGRAEPLRLMLLARIPVGAPGSGGATLLHHAALGGSVETVRVVLAANPPLEIQDKYFHATPLGWAVWASENYRQAGGDYAGVVRELFAAGAKVPPGTSGSEAVNQVLGSRAEEV